VPDLLADIGWIWRIIRVFTYFLNGYFYSTLFYVKLISYYFNFKQEKYGDDNDKNNSEEEGMFRNNKMNLIKNLIENEKKRNLNKFNSANKKSKNDGSFCYGVIYEEFIFNKPFSYEKDKKINI
jgi:hypothetical protein